MPVSLHGIVSFMRITLGELRKLISEQVTDVTTPLPVGTEVTFKFDNGGGIWNGVVVHSVPGGPRFIMGRRENTHARITVKFPPEGGTGRKNDMLVNFVLNSSGWGATGKENNWMFGRLEPKASSISEGVDDDSDDFNDAVDELMKEPHMRSIEDFAEYKFDEEEETYSTLELQALARNLYLHDAGRDVKKGALATAPAAYRDRVKAELSSYGLKFSPRDKVKQVRGFTSPFHGSNRFAGNHGGSGFEGIRGGHSANTTPSAKRLFDPNDGTSLGMGSKKR